MTESLERRGRRGVVFALVAAAALVGVAGCEPSRKGCLDKALGILPASLRHDESPVRALALEAYRDLEHPIPERELAVIAKEDLGPARFSAMLATSEQAYRNEVKLALLSLVCGGEPSGKVSLEKAETMLPRALDSREPALHAAAMEVYRELNRDAPPGSNLAELLRDEGASVRLTTMMLKARRRRRTDAAYLDRAFREEPDASVRLAAVYGLARLGRVRYIQSLADGLRDESPAVRRNAAMILGLLSNRSAVGMLREHLNDRDPVMRLNVAEAMARLGDRSGLPVVRAIAGGAGGEPWWRVSAILLLGRIGVPSQDIASLREMEIPEHRSTVGARLAAFGARAQLGDYTQVEPLVEVAAARQFDSQDRAFALQLLARAAYGPAWRRVCACLDDGNATVRLSAAWALLSFSTPRARKVMASVSSPDRPAMLTEAEVLRRSWSRRAGDSQSGPLSPSENRGNSSSGRVFP